MKKIDTEQIKAEQMPSAEKIKVLFLSLEPEGAGLTEAEAKSRLGKVGFEKEDTLFVTDEPDTLAQLSKTGYYVIALFHKGNREIAFPEAAYAVEKPEELEEGVYEKAYQRLSGQPWDILETKRLWVRESTVEDVKAFYQIYSHPEITRYIEDLYQEQEAECAYMKSYIEKVYAFFGYGMWTVIWKKTGQIIGRAGLSVREGYDVPELGFVIDVDFQRQGCGFEVCEAILRYAKEELAFLQVQALVREGNVASLRLLKKLGFIYDRNVIEAGCEHKLFLRNL